KRYKKPTQTITLDSNVAVIHNKQGIFRPLCHLHQVADLSIGAETLIANDQLYGARGKFTLQSFHQLDCWIVSLADAKNNFVLRIVLKAVAAKVFVHLGIGAFQRLED